MYKALLLLLASGFAFAQVGIGTTDVRSSEALRINAKTKSTEGYRGLLIPKVKLENIFASPNPVVSPKKNLMVYNPNTDPEIEGFYHFNGIGWDKLSTEDDVLAQVVPTKNYVDTSTDPGAIQQSSSGGAVGYKKDESPTDHSWVKIPGLTKTIPITKAQSNVTILTEGMVQWNISASSSGVYSQTFAVGVFIDGKLRSVRSYYIDGYSQMGCLAQIFDIKVSVENLPIGNHTIDVYAITRNQQSPTPGRQGHGTLTWGAASAPKLPGDNDPRTATCSNINTSPMAEGVMAIYIQEF